MGEFLRRELDAYVHRRTRAGIPWWIYGVSLFVANVIRQIVLWRLDATDVVGIVSFVAMVVGIVGLIQGAAVVVRRRETRRRAPCASPSDGA